MLHFLSQCCCDPQEVTVTTEVTEEVRESCRVKLSREECTLTVETETNQVCRDISSPTRMVASAQGKLSSSQSPSELEDRIAQVQAPSYYCQTITKHALTGVF